MARRTQKKGKARPKTAAVKRAPALKSRPIKRVRKPAPIRSTVSRWVRKLEPATRAERLALLRASLKEVRRYYSGFEARDGFSLRNIKALPVASVNSIARRAQYLRELQSRPAIRLRPRSIHSRQLIRSYTGQGKLQKQKTFLYHTDTPQKTRVRVRGKKVETLRTFTGKDGKEHTAVYRNYYFPFSKKFRTWEQLIDVAAELIKRLPKGRYRVVSALHSDIGAPTDRDMLLRTMQEWFDTYGGVTGKEKFPEGIIGFRWVGIDFKQAEFKLRQSEQIRENYKRREQRRRAKERKLARKRGIRK